MNKKEICIGLSKIADEFNLDFKELNDLFDYQSMRIANRDWDNRDFKFEEVSEKSYLILKRYYNMKDILNIILKTQRSC